MNRNAPLAFTLLDLGYKRAGAVQIFDKNTLDANGNIIPFTTQMAVVTHYLWNKTSRWDHPFKTDAEKFINCWTSNPTLLKHMPERTACEPLPLQTSLFSDLFDVPFPTPEKPKFTFIDLFAGIGGFRLALQNLGGKCVFSSEWNPMAQRTYLANYGELPFGDITQEETKSYIPEGFDVLCAGFPCQPFSIAGVSKKKSLGRETGFKDKTQGTLFFDVADIISRRRPKAFFLENVKNLMSHDKGNTFKVIKDTLEELGYTLHVKIMDGKACVPQHRERIFLIGFDRRVYSGKENFHFPEQREPTKAVRDILLPEVDGKYTLSDKLWSYLQNYAAKHKAQGNGFGYGMADLNGITRTLSARYYKDGSEILIPQGEGKNPRRLSPRECARLMGYPDTFIIDAVSDVQAYRQCGNSVVMPLIQEVAEQLINAL